VRRGGQSGDFQTRLRQRNFREQPADDDRTNLEQFPQDAESSPYHDSTEWQTIVWTLMPGTTIGRAQLSATQRLREAGSLTAGLDAQLLLAHLLGQERSWLFTHHDQELTTDAANAYTELVARRAAGEPIAYLIGRRDFYDITLQVDPRVLIPRPETEFLVDGALDYIAAREEKVKRMTVADIGTGSGAIALTVARHAPAARVIATDISADALEVAKANAAALGLSERVTFCQGDLLAALNERVHLIVANLPYINRADYATLDRDVLDHEPRLALEAGDDGLDLIRRLLADAPQHLLPNGLILLEIGYDQGPAVVDLTRTLIPAVRRIDVEQDYAGLDRVVRIQI
jgi:release factor glutamine methyltransferase